MIYPTRTDCVVDAWNEQVFIWHVQTGPDIGMSRLTGAWAVAIDEVGKVKLLVEKRRVLATSAGEKALDHICVAISQHIDPDATIKNLETAREELQAVYDAHPKRQSLVAPAWPLLPDPIDMHNPPTVATGERTSVALAVARNEQIPKGWIIDTAGRHTTDPKDYRKGGVLLPLGGTEGYKGSGLAAMVEVLCGLLTGLGFGSRADRPSQ